MTKYRIYIAGKVTGLPTDKVWQTFESKEFELVKKGHDVFNPVRIVSDQLKGQEDTWENIMRLCIQILVSCDEIHMLPDWKDSKGAKLEHLIAKRLGITISYAS